MKNVFKKGILQRNKIYPSKSSKIVTVEKRKRGVLYRILIVLIRSPKRGVSMWTTVMANATDDVIG